jgi:hypothetical protein
MNLLLHGIGPRSGRARSGSAPTTRCATSPASARRGLTNPPFGKKSSSRSWARRARSDRRRSPTTARLLDDHLEQAAQLRPARQDAAQGPRPRRRGRARQRALRRRRRRDHPPQPAARVRRPHPAAPAHRHLLRPGREGQRAVLRQEARREGPLDQSSGSTTCAPTSTSRSRPSADARRPGRVRRLLPPREPPPAQATWSEATPEGRWRPYTYDEILAATRSASTSSGFNRRNVAMDRSLLDFQPGAPTRWSVVALPAPQPPSRPDWVDLDATYGVCPQCRARANLPAGAAEARCEHCGGDFAIDWDHPC